MSYFGTQHTYSNVTVDKAAVWVIQAVDRQLDLGRSLQIWLNLQNGVNALFDSTSTPHNLGTQVHMPSGFLVRVQNECRVPQHACCLCANQ